MGSPVHLGLELMGIVSAISLMTLGAMELRRPGSSAAATNRLRRMVRLRPTTSPSWPPSWVAGSCHLLTGTGCLAALSLGVPIPNLWVSLVLGLVIGMASAQFLLIAYYPQLEIWHRRRSLRGQ